MCDIKKYNEIITYENSKKYYEGIYKDINLEIVNIINNIIKTDFLNKNICANIN